jgi:hypothetical protein
MILLRILVAFFLLGCGTASAQQSLGFVSPNIRDDLKLEDAIKGMHSQEELKLMTLARSLRCVIKRNINPRPAVGSWSDGAEHSVLLRLDADVSAVRYLMSRLGREANQKAVIYFHPSGQGSARIYIIRKSRLQSFRRIGAVLDQLGIAFRTLVPTRGGTIVYIIDIENALRNKVREASRRLRARVSIQIGDAAFVGNDSSRDKAQAVFTEEIKQYEVKHPNLPKPCEVKP